MSRRMMRGVVLGTVLMVWAVTGVASTTYNFPVNFATNPTGDWSLYVGPESWSTLNDLTLMAKDDSTTPPRWYNSADFYPTYNWYGQANWILSEHSANHWSDAAVCVFTCPQTGTYSLDNLGIFSQSVNWIHSIGEYLQVLTAPDASTPATVRWATTNNYSYATSYYDDLALVPAVQNMELTAGSKILFSFDLASGSNYSQIQTLLKAGGLTDPYTAPVGGSLTFIPEPVTLVLLGLGFLGLRRRS